jgi:hypothetical protein
VSLRAALRCTLSRLGPLVGATIMTGLAITGGTILFVVPGILLMLRWLFTVQAITIEGLGASQSLKRSRQLMAGRRGRMSLLLLLLTLVSVGLSFGVGSVMPRSIGSLPLIGSLLGQLPNLLLAPLYPAVMTLAYFDARVRNEAFDLEVLAQGLGAAQPPATRVG